MQQPTFQREPGKIQLPPSITYKQTECSDKLASGSTSKIGKQKYQNTRISTKNKTDNKQNL